MRIVTLMENTACRENLAAEHGLSLYIETGKHRILFDAGQSGAFAENAEKLGVDLKAVDLAVLSHGHYDHGGGLARFLELNEMALIYANRYAFEPHYNGKGKYIGLDAKLRESGRIVPVDGELCIGDGLFLRTCPMAPADTAGLTVEENGVLRTEDFRHEQYLLVEEDGKTVCFSGCSHKGILNIAEWFRPEVLVGGFHFMKVEAEETLEAAARRLMELPCVYYTGHCTGQWQFGILKERMGERLQGLSAGKVLEI